MSTNRGFLTTVYWGPERFHGPAEPIRLTEMEFWVAQGIAAGRTSRVIGRDLLIAEDTVKAHVKAVLAKFRTDNRAVVSVKMHSREAVICTARRSSVTELP